MFHSVFYYDDVVPQKQQLRLSASWQKLETSYVCLYRGTELCDASGFQTATGGLTSVKEFVLLQQNWRKG